MNSTLKSRPVPIREFLNPSGSMRWNGAMRPTILVATDAMQGSDGALRIAAARAEATGGMLEVITVLETERHLSSSDGHFGESRLLHRRTARRHAVEDQIRRVLGPGASYGLSVFDGNPASTISRVAIERRAALVVVGLGEHLLAQRMLSDETAIHLARIARIPVLAVPAGAVTPPRHAVVAIDFTEISARAAQAAMDAISGDGRVDLVHVMPHVGEDAFAIEREAPYERWARAQLADLAEHLSVRAGVTVTQVALRGRRAAELLGHATRVGADLIATGTHGRGFFARTLLGSVSTTLLRGTACTMLTLPRDPLPRAGV